MQMEDQGLIAGHLFHSGASEGLGAGGLLETRHRQTTTIPRPGRVCSGGQPTSCSLPTLHVLPLTAPRRTHRCPGDAVHRVVGPLAQSREGYVANRPGERPARVSRRKLSQNPASELECKNAKPNLYFFQGCE